MQRGSVTLNPRSPSQQVAELGLELTVVTQPDSNPALYHLSCLTETLKPVLGFPKMFFSGLDPGTHTLSGQRGIPYATHIHPIRIWSLAREAVVLSCSWLQLQCLEQVLAT